jgi:hypothetical protein
MGLGLTRSSPARLDQSESWVRIRSISEGATAVCLGATPSVEFETCVVWPNPAIEQIMTAAESNTYFENMVPTPERTLLHKSAEDL